MNESLSLIDAVMPEVVATRQNQQNQQKQIVKSENVSGVPATSGSGGNAGAAGSGPTGSTGVGAPSADQNGEESAGGVSTSSRAVRALTPTPEGMEVVCFIIGLIPIDISFIFIRYRI